MHHQIKNYYNKESLTKKGMIMKIEELLKISVEKHASDLHILPHLPPLLRIDGELVVIPNIDPLTAALSKQLIYTAMTIDQQEVFESKLVLDIAVSYSGIGNFRVSILHQMHGISAVFRVIPENVPSFESLDLPAVFKRLLVLSSGLILITGPTGSGKSTTLAAMVEHINTTRASHIITIEDPIEFILKSNKSAINQLQVGRDTPDIATALRASLRHDPDVILLGELRDLETIRLALIAAETGHLVLTTLHASSAPLAISRIVDMFPSSEKIRVRNVLAETVQGVICQTLVKRITEGRVAAFEIMLANPAIRHLIRQDMVTHMESTMQTSGDIGMCTMEQYLQKLAAKRMITTVEARNVTVNWGRVKNE